MHTLRVGIPLFFALTLFKHRRLLSVRDLIDVQHPSFGELESAEQRFGFLFRRYEAEYHWWELMFFFRKLALVSTQAFFSRPLDQCLLTMLALVPGMLGVVRAKPYDSGALDIMEWVACASSFVILFCGFLFFSDLLTSRDSSIVLWFTVSLVVITYLIIFFFVFFDLFPYGVKVAESFKFWLQARRSASGETAEDAEASYRARQRWRRARTLVLRRVRGNARLLFQKEFAVKLTKAVHDFKLFPPEQEDPAAEGEAAAADRELSLQEMLEMLESLSVNIKTLESNDAGAEGGAMSQAEQILGEAHGDPSSPSSSRKVIHRKERSRASIQATFTRIPSMNRDGGGGGDEGEQKLVGTLASELTMVAQNFARGFSKMVGRARDGTEDEEAKQRQIEDILGERLRRGDLKPPALGEGVLKEDVAAFFTDEIPLRVSRALFIKVLMLLEYLRLKEAADADPFWATARGRTMLLEHTLLRRLDPIPPDVNDDHGVNNIRSDGASGSGSGGASGSGGGSRSGGGGGGGGGGADRERLSSEDVAAHLAAVRYHEVLVAHLKQREGEPDLDMAAAGQDPLTQLGSQVSSYSAVFNMG